jgi:glycosyltransferase involved in cell wall biosynthesis
MRIALDVHELLNHGLSGVGRYTRGLLDGLRAAGADVHPVARLTRCPRWRRLRDAGVRAPSWSCWPLLPLRRHDVLHITASRWFDVPRCRRAVVTVHDFWEWRRLESGDISALDASCDRLLASLRRADGAVCVSASTASDLQRFCPWFDKPVAVTHLGASKAFSPMPAAAVAAAQARLGLPPSGYLVYLGHHHQRKNTTGMVRGWAQLGQDAPLLVMVGSAGEETLAPARAIAAAAGLAGRLHILPFLADADIACLLTGARLFLFTPFFEGFGLPLVEAYRCGLPAVVSARGSLPELAHPSSPLVDPADPEAIAAGIRLALGRTDDAAARAELVVHAQRFTWAACAAATLGLYARVA